jgi:hypothetical protein
MSTHFLDLQTRIAALLAPVFPGDTILTESLGDLPQKVERLIMDLGFGLVITTAKGEALNRSSATPTSAVPLIFREELTVSLVHNPLLLPALATAIQALHGVSASMLPASMPRAPVLHVLGHEARDDAPDGVVVHQIRVECTRYFPTA